MLGKLLKQGVAMATQLKDKRTIDSLRVYRIHQTEDGLVLLEKQRLEPLKTKEQLELKISVSRSTQTEEDLSLESSLEDQDLLKLKEDIIRTTLDICGINDNEFGLCTKCGGWTPSNANLALDTVDHFDS